MKYIVINTNEFNGNRKGVNTFYAAPILQGEHKGKYACSENALNEFPELFEDNPTIVELDPIVFQRDPDDLTPEEAFNIIMGL